VVAGDLRAATGLQPFVAQAPLNLVYVDFAKMAETPETTRLLYSAAETGFIGQNVYLYCASEGFSTVIRAMVNREELAQALAPPAGTEDHAGADGRVPFAGAGEQEGSELIMATIRLPVNWKGAQRGNGAGAAPSGGAARRNRWRSDKTDPIWATTERKLNNTCDLAKPA
jgi:nitroreductase